MRHLLSLSLTRPVRQIAGATALLCLSAAFAPAMAQHGPDRGPAGFGGPGLFGGPPEHVLRATDAMLDGLGTTDAQRAQVRQIAQSAAADLKPQHEAGRALQEKAAALLTAPSLDASAAEQVRQQMLAQHDQVSRRMLTAMMDISRVLTPEQRRQLAERQRVRSEAMRERMQRFERERASARP